MGTATVAAGWSGYVASFLHDLGLPPPTVHGFNWLAGLGVLAVTALLTGCPRVHEPERGIVVVKLLVIGLFLAFGVGASAPGELASVPAAEHRPFRAVRVERRPARGGGDLLRLHRV